MPSYSRSLPLAVVCLLASCAQEFTAPPQPPASSSADGAPIATGGGPYTIESTAGHLRGEIGFVFTNNTGRTVSLLNCNGAYALRLEKQVAGEWVSAFSPAVPECLSPPIQLIPGASLPGELEIFAGVAGSDSYPQFTAGQIGGIYRLVIESAYWDYDHGGPPWGDKLPLNERRSNSFEIRTR